MVILVKRTNRTAVTRTALAQVCESLNDVEGFWYLINEAYAGCVAQRRDQTIKHTSGAKLVFRYEALRNDGELVLA
jgi:hypothetical protein